MKSSLTFLVATALRAKVNGFKLKIGLHHTCNNGSGNRPPFPAVIGKCYDDDLRVIEGSIGQGPSMCWPGAKLTLLQFARHVIAVLCRTGFPCNSNGQRVHLGEYFIQRPKRILCYG